MTVLLILSVGSLVGTNILDAVEAFRPDLRVVGVNSEAEAPNNFRCDRVFLAPPAHQADAYWRRIEQVLEQERPDLVLAGRDDDIALMAQWRERHARWAACLATGPSAMAPAMTDKLLGYEWAVARDLPYAPTVAADAPTAGEQCAAWMSELGGALIAKPRAGNGSRGVRILLDKVALAATLGDPELVIQPYLSDASPYRAMAQQLGQGLPLFWTPTLTQYVAQTVIGPHGAVLGRFDMEAKMVAGRCERATPFDHAQFREAGDRYAAALALAGWRGVANVQWVHHPKLGFQVIEFCARVAGGMMPRLLLGFDEMALMLSAWTGKSFERRPALPVSRVALRVTRDVGQDEAASTALREHGSWPLPG
jgi:biotin carboxylase